MKFDPFKWKEVKSNEPIQVPKGRVQLRCEVAAAFFVAVDGYEALAGTGEALTVDLAEPATVTVKAKAGARVFLADPGATTASPGDVTFTNVDRMPHESGTVAEVLRARRMFEMEQRALLKEIRAERDRLKAEKPAEKPAEPAPVPADEAVTQ